MTMIVHLRWKEQCFAENLSLPAMLLLAMVSRLLPILLGGDTNILVVGFYQ